MIITGYEVAGATETETTAKTTAAMKMKTSFTRDSEVRDQARDKGRDLFARKFRIFTNTVEGTVSATASCMCVRSRALTP